MMYDTDILIWVQRGNEKAAALIENADDRSISLLTYMELMQCAANRRQHKVIKDFLRDFNFYTLPITESIGHRASIYIEEYSLSSGLRAGDAIIASTAVEHGRRLVTGDSRHFKAIRELQLKIFKP
ncbi:MAG: type II toxin-antitoxin system VapC family toxin [Spirochaetes bacterium]|nr:type II toxin-antitoxin system VapC family toxin [Spirochaetota bacterium]